VHLVTVCFILISLSLKAQDTLVISLEQAIEQSEYSVDALVAKNQFRAGYWEYRTYRAELLPEVMLNGTIPYYSKSYNEFQNSDGTYGFVSNDYSRINGNLSINQNIPLTGGKLSLETSLQRLDQYGDKSSTRYMGIPVQISLEQPIAGFNRVKWLKKIEPIKYDEAKAMLTSQLEEVRLFAVQYYFNLLLAQANLGIAKQNYENTGKLYKVAEARRKIGQISESDLLQLKISLLKSESYMSDAQTSFNSSMFQLRSFLGYNESVILKPLLPGSLMNKMQLDYSNVLSLALENNQFTHNIQRRLFEASRDLSQAKAERRNINLFASFGWSGQENEVLDIYGNLRDNRLVNIGLRIPILDWGKGKGKVKLAESNRELVDSKIKKEQLEFNQNIFLQVENFNKQFKQLSIASETDHIAQTRYNTSIESFMLGKIDVLNLNDAQVSKDEARRNYIEQTYLLWAYYYQIRSITLYDFIKGEKLATAYDNIVK
jgi:outer membrane protein TolC